MLLEAIGLTGGYGAGQVLHGIDLRLQRGEVLALMGRNGAGKSSTLKALMGLLPERGGSVRFMGRDISEAPAHRIAQLGLGYVPEDRRIFTDLTVLENLAVARQAPRRWSDGTPAPVWTVEALFQLFPNLAEMPHRPGGQMSGGEQQMLTVARTLMGNPYAVLLDEPSEGVAPIVVEQMAHAIRAMKAQGLAVILSEQNAAFAHAVADREMLLEDGQVLGAGLTQKG